MACTVCIVTLQRFVLRRSADAPPLWCRQGRRLIRQQMSLFDAVHGRCKRYQLLAGLIGLLPDFWLAGDSGYYELSMRRSLDNLWAIARWISLFVVTFMLIVASLLLADGELTRDDAVIGPMDAVACAAAFVVGALISAPAARRRVYAALGRLGSTPEEQKAAAVAALVGRGSSDLSALTLRSFRALPFTCLSEDDFSSSGDSGLNAHAVLTELGECDAFLSHSWHDDGSQKWAALCSWARDFERTTGRSPKVWLDKGCIDQQNIDASLAALPFYLAGCDRLVVVAGPTYASRLWCVIEIFTFLFMGGSRDRIDVLPIGDDTLAQVEDRLRSFDAQHAKCFVEEDRERLLGIIEAGFGDYGAFNSLVRVALLERSRESICRRAWERQKQAFGGQSDRAVSPRDRPGVAETEAPPEETQAGGDKLSARFVGARSAGDSIVGMQRV